MYLIVHTHDDGSKHVIPRPNDPREPMLFQTEKDALEYMPLIDLEWYSETGPALSVEVAR